ncbi:hypothetical protein [Deinococcus sp.]|nr:hypothetical protein [Deinococcus sp.]
MDLIAPKYHRQFRTPPQPAHRAGHKEHHMDEETRMDKETQMDEETL